MTATTADAAAATNGAAEVVLCAEGVTNRFGGLTAVNSVDLEIARGTIQGVIGPNGAGKTTFFNMIAGIYHPTEGQIYFEGNLIHDGAGQSFRPDQIAA